MCGDDDAVRARCVGLDRGNQAAELVGQVPASGVGDVEGRGTGLDHLTQDLKTAVRADMQGME